MQATPTLILLLLALVAALVAVFEPWPRVRFVAIALVFFIASLLFK